MPRLEILGGFALLGGDGRPVLLPKKARALLAYLALAEGRTQPRDRLAALLWEESPGEQARASLRQALAAIRRGVDADDWLRADGETVWLDTAMLEVDAAQFLALAAGEGAQQAEAAALYRGDLLDGLELTESGYSAWLAAERARLRDVAVRMLEAGAAAALAERRTDAALALAGRLLALDPMHEPGTRLAMRAYSQGGRHAEALRQYRTLQATLRRELGVAPEAETVALRDELVGRRRRPTDEDGTEVALADEATVPCCEGDAGAEGEFPAPAPVPRRERRRLAVLSVGIAGYAALSIELDVERLYTVIETWHGAIDAEVRKAGGVVHDRMGDTALAVFGRDQARDDDPARAAAAAFAIHRRVEAIGAELGLALKARAGLAAGVALLSEGPYEAAIVGEPVTTAATLRAEAPPGGTLATAAVAGEIGGRVLATPAGDGRMVLAPGCGDGRLPPLVGRLAELRQLGGLRLAAQSGAGLSVCLRGEAGIGKSRLAEALAEAAAAEGWRVHRAQIADFGGLAAHTPRRQLVRSLLGNPEPDSLAGHPLAVKLGEEHLPWLFQLAGVAALPALQLRQEAGPDGAAAAARSAAARALLEAAAAESPLLLLVEDVHWATSEALRQLAMLTQLVGTLPVLLVLTGRPEPEVLDLSWRAAAGPLVTIDLKPLSPGESLALAYGFGAVTDTDAAVCAGRANGNPLFLAQLVAAVRDGAAADTALPGSVQSLALGRMDRLAPEERRALRAAAVLGPRAGVAAVAAVAGLEAYLPSPLAAGTLVTSDGTTLVFVHALIRDAIYSSLMEAERRDLHDAAAGWYRGTDPDLVAAHLAGAGSPEAAEAYAAAAEAALGRHRPDKALEAVQRGLALATCRDDRHRLLLVQSQALARELRLQDAAAAAREAGTLAADAARRVQALILEATALSGVQKAREALAVLEAAEAAAGEQPDAMARIFALRGNIHFPRGELDQCLAAHSQSLTWSKKAGTPIAEAGALVGLAWAHYQRGDFAAVEAEAGLCLAMAEDAGGDGAFDRIRLSALRVRSVSRVFLLSHTDALADAMAAIALAQAQGDAINELLARTTAGTVHLEQWNQAAATEIVQPALAMGERLGNTGLEAAPLWVLGTALGASGDIAGGRRVLEEARAHGMRGKAIRFAVPRILGTLAFFVEPPVRAALAAEGEAMLAVSGVVHSAFGFHGSLVHAGLVHGEWALSDRCADGLAAFAGAQPVPWAAAVLQLARLFSALGRGMATDAERAEAAALHARARATPALGWLRPSMKAVEKVAGMVTAKVA